MNSKIRLVKTDNGYDAVVSDWYFKKQTQGMQVVKEYATLDRYMQDITDDYTDEAYMSDDECIWQAIDDGLIYYADQAYVVAHALQNGFIEWGKEPLWDEITEMLYSDVSEALEELKKGEEDDTSKF